MSPPDLRPAQPFRWLADALQLVRAHAGLFLVAASSMLLVSLLPALLNSFAASVLPDTLFIRSGVFVLFTLLLLPPVTGGFYRLCHAAYLGKPMRPSQLFEVLADGPASARLVLVNLVYTLLLVLGVFMPVAAIGGAPLADWMQQLMIVALAAQQAGTAGAAAAPMLPPMPPGTGLLFSAGLVLALLISTARELAMAQAALGSRAPLEAVADGMRVALRHAGAFLLFYIPAVLMALLGFFALTLAAAIVAAVLGLVSAALAYLVIMLAAVAVGLGYYALVFAFFYRAWHATLAEGAAAPPAPVASHGIEL
jgi:hypothetical protein